MFHLISEPASDNWENEGGSHLFAADRLDPRRVVPEICSFADQSRQNVAVGSKHGAGL